MIYVFVFLIFLIILGIAKRVYSTHKIQRIPLDLIKSFDYMGSKQNYAVIGSGKPVVLLHGSMISNPWGGFEKLLAKHYTVYIPDLPGFGASEAVKNKIHNTLLFADAFSEFLKVTKNEKTPVIAFSLGTVVAARAAASGVLKGLLIMVGTPGKVESTLLKVATKIPVCIRRFIGSTAIGRERLLIPILWEIIGVTDGDVRTSTLPGLLKGTDVRSLVDINVFTEIEKDMPVVVSKLKNSVTYIYGQNDGVRKTTDDFIIHPIVINNADHNVFTSNPRDIFALIRTIIH